MASPDQSELPASEVPPPQYDYIFMDADDDITIVRSEIVPSGPLSCITSTSKTWVHFMPTFYRRSVTYIFIISKCNDCVEIERGNSDNNELLIEGGLYMAGRHQRDFLPHRKSSQIFRRVLCGIRCQSFAKPL